MSDNPPKGFLCTDCGEGIPFTGYVYAHWREVLKVICPDCGQAWHVVCGQAFPANRRKRTKILGSRTYPISAEGRTVLDELKEAKITQQMAWDRLSVADRLSYISWVEDGYVQLKLHQYDLTEWWKKHKDTRKAKAKKRRKKRASVKSGQDTEQSAG